MDINMNKKIITKLLWFTVAITLFTHIPTIPVTAAAPSMNGFVQPIQTLQTITQSAYETAAEQTSRIPNTDIQSYENNGGQYSASSLNKAFDNDINTHWETGTPNSASHTNTVTVTFKNNVTPGSIDYMCRHDGTQPKGSVTEYKLYYSTTATGENFQLLTEGGFPGPYSNMVSIHFPTTTMKRFRIEFTECHENWASMSELRFYNPQSATSQDTILSAVFADKTYSTLKPGINTSFIDTQINQANASMTGVLRDKTVEILNEGIRLAGSAGVFDPLTFTLSQRGNMESERIRTRSSYGFYNFDATGFYISPNETISVYADFDPNDPAPTLIFGQIGEVRGSSSNDSWAVNGWKRDYSLKPGINVITAPSWSSFGPSAIYFENDCAPEDQSRAPKVRIVGGTRFPLYVHGETDPAVFRAELEAYVSNVVPYNQEASHFNRTANNLTTMYYDICEAVSEHTVLSSSATGCKKALDGNPSGKTMSHTMDVWEEMHQLFSEYSGFNTTDPSASNYIPGGKYICRVFWVKNPGVAAYATNGYTAYNAWSGNKQTATPYSEIFAYQTLTSGNGWAYYHEIGHQYDHLDTDRAEVTNNLYSLAAQDYFTPYPTENRLDANGPSGSGSQNMWPRIKEGNRTGQHPMLNQGSNYPEPTHQNGDNVWYQLAEIYQLIMAYDQESIQNTGYGIYGAMRNITINNPELFADNNSRTAAVENMALAMSLALERDITAHFEHYKHVISTAAKNRTGVSSLPKETAKTWYADSTLRDPASTGFTDPSTAMPIVGYTGSGSSFKLTLGINEAPNTLLCYEIWQGNTLLGVSYGNEFAISNGSASTTYKVIAYDRKCKPSLTWEGLPGTVTNDPAQDNLAIAGAKAAIESASYTATQASVSNISQANAAATSIINSLPLNGVSISVTDGLFTAAVAGIETDPEGANGSYTFTVNLNKGLGTPVTTIEMTLTITATPYNDSSLPLSIKAAQVDASLIYGTWMKGNLSTAWAPCTWKNNNASAMPLLYTDVMSITEPGTYYLALAATARWSFDNNSRVVQVVVDADGNVAVQGYNMNGSSLGATNNSGKISYNPNDLSVLVVSWGGIPSGNIEGTP